MNLNKNKHVVKLDELKHELQIEDQRLVFFVRTDKTEEALRPSRTQKV